MPRDRAFVCFSSGRDAASTLHALRRAGEVDGVGLLNNVNAEFDGVAIRAVRLTVDNALHPSIHPLPAGQPAPLAAH